MLFLPYNLCVYGKGGYYLSCWLVQQGQGTDLWYDDGKKAYLYSIGCVCVCACVITLLPLILLPRCGWHNDWLYDVWGAAAGSNYSNGRVISHPTNSAQNEGCSFLLPLSNVTKLRRTTLYIAQTHHEERACPQNSDMFLPAYSIDRMNNFYPTPRQPQNLCHGFVVLGIWIGL